MNMRTQRSRVALIRSSTLMTIRKHSSLRLYLLVLFICSLVLNWFWEMLHMPGFVEMAGRTWMDTAWRCFEASISDVMMTFLVYGIISLLGHRNWIIKPTPKSLFFAAVLGACLASGVELFALKLGRWHYTEAMPVVPILGVGFWPFMQLTLLIPLSLYLSHRVCSLKR